MEREFLSNLQQAQQLKIPLRFMIDGKNIIELIAREINDGVELSSLSQRYPSLFSQDLIGLYSLYRKSEQVLEEINDWLESISEKPIRDKLELRLLTEKFREQYKKDFQADADKIVLIESLQEQLDQENPLPVTNFTLQSTQLVGQFNWKGKRPTSEDAYLLFDEAEVSPVTPYLHWQTGLSTVQKTRQRTRESIYKIYKGLTPEQRPNLTDISVVTDSKNETATFLFTTKGLQGQYRVENNLFQIGLPDSQLQPEVVENIENLFSVKTVNVAETDLSGKAYIFGVDIDPLLLSHMILNYEIFSTFFFTRDTLSNLVEPKKTFKLYYQTGLLGEESEKVSLTLQQMRARGDESFVLTNGETYNLSSNMPYLEVKFRGVSETSAVAQVLDLLSRLLTVYLSEVDELKDLYLSFIPNYEDLGRDETGGKVGASRDSKIARLAQAAPDLFISGYARKCLCPVQPIIVPDDEIETWENKTFIHKGRVTKRQVMRFPPNSDQPLNFVCPDNQNPFPGVKKNTLSNQDKYLGLPCCYGNDQIGEGANSNYKKFYEGQVSEVKDITGHMVRSDKILEPGRYGVLPKSITELFSRVTSREVLRRGVPRDQNSLLHCVAIAAGDKKYLKATPEERTQRITRLRESIAKKTEPGLVRQQLYDYTDEEIVAGLKTGVLDPNLYYRMIEEAYKINLFVFAPSENEEKRLSEKRESTGAIQLPRYKLFYARTPQPERPSVCVYRTMGSERDALEFPQCELIVFRRDEKDQSLFGSKVYQFLWETWSTTYQTYNWELVQTPEGIDTVTRKNVSNQVDFQGLFPQATAQLIDEWGKMRALYLLAGKSEIMITVIPSAPVNLPSRQDLVVSTVKNVLEILTEPTGKTVNDKGETDGLWFSILDLPYALYVPVKGDIELPLGPHNPLPRLGVSVVPRIYKLERDLNYLVQIFRWLYSLTDLSLQEFVEKYVGVGRNEKFTDSAQIYDFNNVGRQFPKVANIEQGIREMTKRVPSLFSNGRMFLYSEKLFSGLYYLTEKYLRERVTGKLETPTNIVTQPLTETDFTTAPGVALFLSQQDLENWFRQDLLGNTILTQIPEEMAYRSQPYLYQDADGHIYMIQNVMGGSLGRALTISQYWEEYRINLGYKQTEESVVDSGYVVYGISPSRSLVPVLNTSDSNKFYSVIQYNPKNYGAILRLL